MNCMQIQSKDSVDGLVGFDIQFTIPAGAINVWSTPTNMFIMH